MEEQSRCIVTEFAGVLRLPGLRVAIVIGAVDLNARGWLITIGVQPSTSNIDVPVVLGLEVVGAIVPTRLDVRTGMMMGAI
jgi:hypothetical protein